MDQSEKLYYFGSKLSFSTLPKQPNMNTIKTVFDLLIWWITDNDYLPVLRKQ